MRAALLFPLCFCLACSESKPRDDGDPAPGDGASGDVVAGDPFLSDWHDDHCAGRECYFVMQGVAGAHDVDCNGEFPTDLGTVDGDGKGNCPFASFRSGALRQLMNPQAGENKSRTFFVGAGTYQAWPHKLQLVGDGANADEAVILTNYKGGEVTLDGGDCPATCTVDGPTGPVELDPCCPHECNCGAAPQCQAVLVGGVDTGECGVEWDKIDRILIVMGSWVRVEGIHFTGCAEDAVVVSARPSTVTPPIAPNDSIFISNNRIGGCDINENIKAFRQGPGPLDGGPAWGPTHVIGNEFYDMNSQAIDATGVHNWLVEESWVHDAKTVHPVPGQSVDGGGIGFKNGGSQARVRNNWLSRGGGVGFGGGSGSCVSDYWGCFQEYEFSDGLAENNTVLESAAQKESGTGSALYWFHCRDCSLIGNVVQGVNTKNGVLIDDQCPGVRCDYNPNLLPTLNARLERNFVELGAWQDTFPLPMGYPSDIFATGPAANGMVSGSNIFCLPDGYPSKFGGPDDPAANVAMWYHIGPASANVSFDTYAPLIGDSGTAVYNGASATVSACPAGPPACALAVDDVSVTWAGPTSCAGCTCSLVWDEDAPVSVACNGTTPIPAGANTAGRHYVSLRVDNDGGGTSCGSSYQVASAVIGAGCRVHIEGNDVVWNAEGVRCQLVGDGDRDLGTVECSGTLPLPSEQLAAGRHHVRLHVRDSALGQTACGTVFNR